MKQHFFSIFFHMVTLPQEECFQLMRASHSCRHAIRVFHFGFQNPVVEGPNPNPTPGPKLSIQRLKASLGDQEVVVFQPSESSLLLQKNINRKPLLDTFQFRTDDWGQMANPKERNDIFMCDVLLHMLVYNKAGEAAAQSQRLPGGIRPPSHLIPVWLAEGLTCPSVLCQCHYANNADSMPLISSSAPIISISMYSSPCWQSELHTLFYIFFCLDECKRLIFFLTLTSPVDTRIKQLLRR